MYIFLYEKSSENITVWNYLLLFYTYSSKEDAFDNLLSNATYIFVVDDD